MKPICDNYMITGCCLEHAQMQAFCPAVQRICKALIDVIVKDGRLYPPEVIEAMELFKLMEER